MSKTGARLIGALQDAVDGNFARVHIDGQTWVRLDDVKPRIEALEQALREIATTTSVQVSDDTGRIRVVTVWDLQAVARAALAQTGETG